MSAMTASAYVCLGYRVKDKMGFNGTYLPLELSAR